MKVDGFKFDIEKVSDTIVKEVENLLTDDIVLANNFGTLANKFGKVTRMKQKYKVESIDIVFVWKNKDWDILFNKESYKLELAELYNRINYKFGEAKKIPTFFRGGQKEAPSFHLPAGLNIWFLTINQFLNSKIKPYVVLTFGENLHSYLTSKFDNKENKELFNEMRYYVVDVNEFFNLDEHIKETWSKK